jgi:tetratricopeptide (TPR) repeat protein
VSLANANSTHPKVARKESASSGKWWPWKRAASGRRRCPFFCIFLFSILASGLSQASARPQEQSAAPLSKKELEAKAKELVAEGKALEKQGQLDDAKDKYIDAEGYISTKDGLNGIGRIRDAKKTQVEVLLQGAHQDCDAGRTADCAKKLEKALNTSPDKTVTLHYDLALCYQKLGDRANALTHLGEAISATQDTGQRVALVELRTQMVLGNEDLRAVSADAAKKIEGFNHTYMQTDRDPVAAKGLCDQLKDLPSGSPVNAAVAFNQAKCAAEDARDADAAQLLDEYLKLAPNALDASETQVYRDSLLSLAARDGDAGAQVRAHFAAADLDLDYRRYDRALQEYLAAEQIAPQFALTYWRLALLYEAAGDVANSRDCLTKYLPLEADPVRRSDAQAHLDSLDQWRSFYDDNVGDAHELMSDLLTRSMGLSDEGLKHHPKKVKGSKIAAKYRNTLSASETLSPPFARRQIDRAHEDLDEAMQLFPIAPEANQLMALVQLEDNDWPSAFRSYDAVASAGQPVAFYAQLNSSRENKFVLATKVEIGKDSLRFVYLSSYNARKKITEPPDSPAGEDGLGNLFTSAALPPDTHAETLVIPVAELEGVRTDKSFVTIKLHKQQILLAPVYMLSNTPLEGHVARELGNEYTRMFVRYLGYEQARLGKEGMTFGEKLRLGYTVFQAGMSFFNAVATGGMGAFGAFQSTMKLSHALQTDAGHLRHNLAEQRRALEGLEFKPIPIQPAQLAFRDHL